MRTKVHYDLCTEFDFLSFYQIIDPQWEMLQMLRGGEGENKLYCVDDSALFRLELHGDSTSSFYRSLVIQSNTSHPIKVLLNQQRFDPLIYAVQNESRFFVGRKAMVTVD